MKKKKGWQPRPPAEERFWANVNKEGPSVLNARCWLWVGPVMKDGYGTFSVNKKLMRAHRYSYQLLVAPIPEGKIILHACDVPLCVNPEHLSAGTWKDNSVDASRKGRMKNHRRKLNADQVQFIIQSELTNKELAKRFSVSDPVIRNVRLGRCYKEILKTLTPLSEEKIKG